MLNYWISIGIADFIKYSLYIVIVYPFMVMIDPQSINSLFIIGFFVITSLLFAYVFSFRFEKEESGQKFFLLISYMSMILLVLLAIFSNKQILENDNFSIQLGSFFPFPSFALSMLRLWIANLSSKVGDTKVQPRNIIRNAFFEFLIQVTLYALLLYLADNKIIERLKHKLVTRYSRGGANINLNAFNSYNIAEKQKLENSINASAYTVRLKQLTKIYKGLSPCTSTPFKAVDNLYLALEANEKFGLMGFNGSGKTTTFKSITDEILFDYGKIELFDLDTQVNFETIRKNMGYCPQSNALFDYLTVEETLQFYIKLKDSSTNQSIDDILIKFGLQKFKKTICTNLSGGNKRKLNFAIALMNNPKIILLDEPSTGVDPESRRTMWRNINDIPKFTKEFNMLLSTHSMEEAEILCDTIGWMKNGNFVCIGNPEKLKLQFSQGYYLHIKFRRPSICPDNRSVEFVRNRFSDLEGKLENFSSDLLIHILNKNDNFSLEYISHFEKLDDLINKIRPLCRNIKLSPIDYDNSGAFELIINVESERQGYLFSNLLKLKTHDSDIIEINLNMQSLENILTHL